MRWLEIMAAAREDYHEILMDPERHGELSTRMQKLITRAEGSNYTDLETNGETWIWYLWRFWVEAPDDLDEFDYSSPELRFLDRIFKDEWGHFRPFGVFWWDTGMQTGTRYKEGQDGEAGDVETLDSAATPWFPFDYAKAKRFIPDLVIYDYDQDGTPIEPPTTYDLIHDIRPHMVTTGQFSLSKGRYHGQRRAMQETTNQKLGAGAFGLQPWSPSTYVDTRRVQREG